MKYLLTAALSWPTAHDTFTVQQSSCMRAYMQALTMLNIVTHAPLRLHDAHT